MPARKKTTANPVAFPNRYFIEGYWRWEETDVDTSTILLTKEQAEEALNEQLTAMRSPYSYRYGSGDWGEDEEPMVYVLLDDGTFRLVDVDMPVSNVTIKE